MFGLSKKIIVTHSGRFHADDLFATAMLLEYLDGKAKVIRSVDPSVIATGDFVLDIGRIYDPAKNRFDHHQGGVGARSNGISYASAGLVWKNFGEKIAGSKEVANKVDGSLVISIDAFDTGDASPKPFAQDLYPYMLNDIAATFGSTWKETTRSDTEAFIFLLPFARSLLQREIIRARDGIEASVLTNEAYQKALDKRIIILDKFLPMDGLEDKPDVLFVVFPHNRGGWAVHALRKNKHEYGNRKDFPKAWAGKSDVDLAKVSGVPDATFCHLKLFLAVAKSKEGAIRLAQIAVGS